jgi:transcriptional regulator of met regulon
MQEEIKTNEKTKKEFFTVPLEVLMDIFKILFDNKIKHRVVSIRERENSVCMEALIDSGQTNHNKGLENIVDILGTFEHYLHEGLNNEFS